MHLTGIFAADPHPEPDVTPECAVSRPSRKRRLCSKKKKKKEEKHESPRLNVMSL